MNRGGGVVVLAGARLNIGELAVGLAHHLGDAPVEHRDLPEVSKHDVVRLEIAMNDAPHMRELDREADLGERAQQPLL
jgi:hypothetical protein